MKDRSLYIFSLSILLGYFPSAYSQTLTWDANGTGAAQTNGAGSWLGSNLWWNGSANQSWVAGSDAIFGGPSSAGGAVTLSSATSVGSITFNAFTGTYTLGTTGSALTINGGINKTTNAAAVTLAGSPIVLGAAQIWSNLSSPNFIISVPVNNGGNTLTLEGSGTTNFSTVAASAISGSGGLTFNGNGRLFLGGLAAPAHSYSGNTTLNGGVTMTDDNNFGPGNLVLNGGLIESYWQDNFVRSLGAGNGQIQIIGGVSGFGNNNGGSSVILSGNAAFEVVWGAANEASNASATGFFNPTRLALQTQFAQNAHTLNFQNRIDLNGSNRTIQTNAGSALTSTATISGIIRNSRSGSPAGIVKTGSGVLILTAANTYDGGTTIDGGSVRFSTLTSMPAAGSVTVNTGATLTIETGASGDWTGGTSGVGTLGGIFAGLGSSGTSTVNFVGDATLGLEMTGNVSYTGDIPNLGSNLSITKTGGSSLTLTGNNSFTGGLRVSAGTLSFNSVENIAAGSSALGAPTTPANGTINIGSGSSAATITYTGSGHSTNRVVNLSGSSGGATLNASGTGALLLTSAITSASGAKTLTLTGNNTANNSLAASTLTLAELLTVSKSGTGTWVINGFSSPKNVWTVSDGTLIVNGGITTGDQNFNVTGGVLAGSGPITLQSSKSLTVQAGGSLSPGSAGAGTLAVTGILNISAMANGTGKLRYDIATPAASDRISVTGTLNIGTGLLGLNDFVFNDLGGMTSSTYTLISTTGGIVGTLDPANRIGSIGSLNGALQINGNNLEFTLDSDLDGIPDSYELANTSPSSATAFNPTDDLDADGSSNLQEYLTNTNPNLADTDADGFLDGVETNTGTWVSATNTGTNPLVFDTDGDTIRDGYETNTGLWVSSTNLGSSPLRRDTDLDSLADNLETGTGVLVSRMNTGTNPNLADTDGDGAGDWYETVIIDQNPALGSLPNGPNSPTIKPNIPYPLPDPDSSTGVSNKPVKVYIMSGQSNMVGIGHVNDWGEPGSLATIVRNENKFPNLLNSSNGWTQRQDVLYRGVITAIGQGPLTAGQGSDTNTIGPELGFGHVMGYYHDEPVLLLKSSEGNRSLSWDILPPGSLPFNHTVSNVLYTYAGYGQSPERWLPTQGPAPANWYAGRQYDDFFVAESDRGSEQWQLGLAYTASGNLGTQVKNNGVAYMCKLAHTSSAATEPGVGAQWNTAWNVLSVTNVVDVLDNFSTQYPQWANQGFEIAGFVWWQGHKDQAEPSATRYEQNLVRLIQSLRSYYGNRYPGKGAATAPFVLGTIGFDSWDLAGDGLQVANAQLAVSDPVKYPAFAGNVKTMETRNFWRTGSESPGGQGFHYNNNAETYMLVGDALGRAMIDLRSASSPLSAYQTWTDSTFASVLTNSSASVDFDNGGLKTGIEWVLGGDPTSGADDSFVTPTIDRATDPNGKLLFIFRRDIDAKNDANTSITVEYGSDLMGWTPAIHQGSAANQITVTEQSNGFGTGIDRVTVAIPSALSIGSKMFARLKVVVANE